MRPRFAAFVLALLAAPLALAQEHHDAGDGVALVLHDGPDSGRAVVGGFTHFGFALLDNDGVPAPHRNAAFTLLQDGAVLFATNDTHEYDGHFSFDYVFTKPGPYQVIATSDKMKTTIFEGQAVAPSNATQATIIFEKASSPQANAVAGKLSIVDAAGAIIPHTDAIVEFRSGGASKLAARFHLHVHDEAMAFTQALPSTPASTDFEMRVIAFKAFATGKSEDVEAVVASFPVTVGLPPTLVLPANPGLPPPIMEPAGAMAKEGDVTLYGMYDAQNQVGLGNPLRFVGVIEQNGTILPHVDFALTVTGPRGLVYESKSIHEYDGVVEYEFLPDLVGLYDATLTADTGDAKLSVPFHAQVVPPVVPLAMAPGLGFVEVKGFDGAAVGMSIDLTFRVATAAGPVQHSEVDVTIYHADEAPIYSFKLHTHDSGETKATVVFPHAAEWIVRVDPLSTSPDPTVFAGATTFKATLTGEAPVVATIRATGGEAAPASVPGLGVLATLAAAIAALALARARRSSD